MTQQDDSLAYLFIGLTALSIISSTIQGVSEARQPKKDLFADTALSALNSGQKDFIYNGKEITFRLVPNSTCEAYAYYVDSDAIILKRGSSEPRTFKTPNCKNKVLVAKIG